MNIHAKSTTICDICELDPDCSNSRVFHSDNPIHIMLRVRNRIIIPTKKNANQIKTSSKQRSKQTVHPHRSPINIAKTLNSLDRAFFEKHPLHVGRLTPPRCICVPAFAKHHAVVLAARCYTHDWEW